MADEYVNVTVGGKTFDIRVPKGSSDDYVEQAAKTHYSTNYSTDPGQLNKISPEKMGEGDIRGDEVAKHNLYSGARAGAGMDELFGAGMGSGLLRAPASALSSYGAAGGAAAAGLPWYAQLAAGALAGSPKLSGAIKGGAKAFGPTAEGIIDTTSNAGRKLSQGIGGGIGGLLGGWRGLVAGRDLGPEVLPPLFHPGEMAKGIGEGAIRGASEKPLMPQLMRDIPPEPQVNFSGETQPRIRAAPRPNEYPQIPGRVFNMPPVSPEFPPGMPPGQAPPAQITKPFQVNIPPQLGPARVDPFTVHELPMIEAPTGPPPIITPPPVQSPQKLLGPTSGEFWRGPGAPLPQINPVRPEIIPGPQEYFRPRSAEQPKVIKPSEINSNPKMSDVPSTEVKPKIEDQQVPENTKSVKEALPSGKALTVTPPRNPDAQRVLDRLYGKTKNLEGMEKVPLPTPAETKAKAIRVNPPSAETQSKSLSKKVDPPSGTAAAQSKETSAMNKVKELGWKETNDGLTHEKNPNEVINVNRGNFIHKLYDSSGKWKSLGTGKLSELPKHLDDMNSAESPHFTHEIMGKIAKELSDKDNKVTLQEVGRYVHENKLGTYQEGQFNKDYGASRKTKTELSENAKKTKGAKEALIGAGIKKFMKENPHLF